MLTPSQLDSITDPIVSLYQQYEETIITDIARRLAKLDFTSAAWQVQRLSESGKLYDAILDELVKLTNISRNELKSIFAKAGVKALKFDDEIYRAAGLNPLPLNLSPNMVSVLQAGLVKTSGMVENFVRTTALTGQQAFINASDIAYMQVSSGAMSYIQAITDAVKKVAADGIPVIQYAGHNDQIDVAVRRAVLTGVSQTTGKLQEARADDMGCDLVQTSAHAGARPSHQVWQGRIFSRSGKHPKYPNFVESTGYGTGPGLMGWNCCHSFYPFFEGISENIYTREMLKDLENRKVTYQGEEISLYDATQVQRGIERKIRYWKRQKGALDAAGIDSSAETAKVKEWQASMRSFLNETKLQRQSEREKISYVTNLSSRTSKIDFHSKEYQKITELGNIANNYSSTESGIKYITQRPVIYNKYASSHLTDESHKWRLSWLEENQEGLIRAIQSPDFIEKSLRLRKDGHYSSTQIVELRPGTKDEKRFMTVAISLSLDPQNGYHQITTIHPAIWKDIFLANGNLKSKYLKIK